MELGRFQYKKLNCFVLHAFQGCGNRSVPIKFVYSFVFLILFLTSKYRGLQVIRCGRCCASSSSPFVFCDVRFKLFPRYVFLPFLNFNFPIYNLSCYVRLGFDLLTRICLHIIDRVYSYLYSPKYNYKDAFGKRNFGQVRNFCLFF